MFLEGAEVKRKRTVIRRGPPVRLASEDDSQSRRALLPIYNPECRRNAVFCDTLFLLGVAVPKEQTQNRKSALVSGAVAGEPDGIRLRPSAALTC